MSRARSRAPVLIVDDHNDTREALAAFLETDGFAVTAVADGEAALAALRAGPRPCLIVLDLFMPKMDGFRFLDAVRAVRAWARIPVIVLSGQNVRPETTARSLGISPDHCLLKPSDPEELKRLVAMHCRRYAGDASGRLRRAAS